MRPEERDPGCVWDMLDAARSVREFTTGVTQDEYLADRKLQLAVERALEIIGEAARLLSPLFKANHAEIKWKITEAEYFLNGIAGAADDPNATRYQASAFLTAARSVLQYAREEAMTKAGGQQWYDNAVVRDPAVKFLKDHRDINVHERPLPMRTHTTIEIGAAVLTLQSTLVATIIRGATGEQEHRVLRDPVSSNAPPVPVSLQPVADGNRSYAYEFKDWPGSEDLLTLCRCYLDEIKRIVADGRARGFLTP